MDGAELQVRLRLGRDDTGQVTVQVRGRTQGDRTASAAAEVELTDGDNAEGARALFWVHEWGGGAERGGEARGTAAGGRVGDEGGGGMGTAPVGHGGGIGGSNGGGAKGGAPEARTATTEGG